MSTVSLTLDGTAASTRKRPRVRRIIGIALLVLTVVFALLATLQMQKQIDLADESAKPLLQRALQNDLIVAVGFAIVAIGIAFDVLTGVRNKVIRVLGYVIWAAGIMVAAEAVLMSASVIVSDMSRSATPDAPYALVLGTPLTEDNTVPGELSARLSEAAKWQKQHADSRLIVTGSGKATKKKNTSLAGLSIVGSPVDTIGASLVERDIPEDSILKVGRSDTDEQSFENMLKQDEIGADTPMVVVVNNFDMNRTVRLANDMGFTSVTPIPATPNFLEAGTVLMWKVWNEYDPAVRQTEESGE